MKIVFQFLICVFNSGDNWIILFLWNLLFKRQMGISFNSIRHLKNDELQTNVFNLLNFAILPHIWFCFAHVYLNVDSLIKKSVALITLNVDINEEWYGIWDTLNRMSQFHGFTTYKNQTMPLLIIVLQHSHKQNVLRPT